MASLGMRPAEVRQPPEGIFEPFPRQALVGLSAGLVSYLSPVYDVSRWRSLVWWFQVWGSIPGSVGLPLTAYVETGESPDGPWMVLVSQAAGVTDVISGVVSDPGSLLRVRIDIEQGEITSAAFRMNGRKC